MWAVGVVPHNSEFKCLAKLKELAIEGFVPLGKRYTKPSRKKQAVIVAYKLFPGYVFVNIPQGFEFFRLKNVKISFLYSRDGDGEPYIAAISPVVMRELLERDDLRDLFEGYDKKFVRNTYQRNQLVCWRHNTTYMLGFISRNTQGKQYAYVKIAGGKELKISVALLSLL